MPRIHSLEAQAKNQRRSKVRDAIVKGLASCAVVALGMYGGIASHFADVLKTGGGISFAKDLAEAIGAITRNPSEVRNNNLYFLLRLRQSTNPADGE